MKAAATLGEATRTGHPAVVIVCCALLLLVLLSMWLWHARRPIPPPRGKLTVRDLQARLDYEVQAEIEQARLAEFRRTAEEAAAERAGEDTEVLPKVEDTVFPEAESPRKGEKPDKARCG
ncbi:hypothetical protein G3I59_28120 [Amycolatopsis rubida]|uniref:Uncharacterized protein n=1 Tax=Amycolatopsis rubida TaxID=112413 RepID=A0A1I5V565_9PSEU|nr:MULTISPECIES: hypothetical protein [Amycolatopsis]MYW94356.1 hypothetical protein [Amycolatopsis rubida]NEC59345.1 hypothetical protein [Amycolatopsis rubida]OAP26841.1 hypothetical protein A4R44_02829 [Amycolatopsis sp. M39]SFQ02076.1 hypothetical protein SAMN05421854_108203 [Amycolatopsis rubida]